jgi:hypothetical protein
MKKLIVFGCFIIFSALLPSCNGGNKKVAAAVPEVVLTAFNNKYPGTTDVKWETENKNGQVVYEGEFKMNGKHTEADFDENGKFLNEQ